MQTHNLVPGVGQVDPEHSHAMQDKLHGGQQVIQHSRLQKMNQQVKQRDGLKMCSKQNAILCLLI